MNEEQTCGKGLAERSVLPTKLAELTGAMAEILAFHQRSLDFTDANARKEFQAYVRLEGEYRIVSSFLKSTAAAMSGYRDLPMGRHDVQMLGSAENAEIFARFLRWNEKSRTCSRKRSRKIRGCWGTCSKTLA